MKNPSPQNYNTIVSEFTKKDAGAKFGASRDKLKFNSFQEKYLEKVYVPCATSYDVAVKIGQNAPKASFGLKENAHAGKHLKKALLPPFVLVSSPDFYPSILHID